MKKNKTKIISLLICFLLYINTIPVFFASASEPTFELLFVSEETTYSSLLSELGNPSVIVDESQVDFYNSSDIDISESIITNFNLFDCALITDISELSFSDYKAIALPITNSETVDIARKAYNEGLLVYLYGQLTIDDYKAVLSIDNFTLPTTIYGIDESICGTVEQGFDATFEEQEIYNVICYSKNTLLCKFGNSPNQVNYLVAALNNCVETPIINKTRATIVQSEFDFTTYWGTNNQFAVHLDYTLYRETNETSSTYDYFAIKTRTWLTINSGKAKAIMTKYELPFTTDNLLETGPESQSNIGSLSGSIGFGSSDGLNGAIGYSIDLSDQRPTIERTENYTDDIVEWELTPRPIFPKDISDAQLVCVATWASTGKIAGIVVSYQGAANIGSNSQYPIYSGYTEIPIYFSYSD